MPGSSQEIGGRCESHRNRHQQATSMSPSMQHEGRLRHMRRHHHLVQLWISVQRLSCFEEFGFQALAYCGGRGVGGNVVRNIRNQQQQQQQPERPYDDDGDDSYCHHSRSLRFASLAICHALQVTSLSGLRGSGLRNAQSRKGPGVWRIPAKQPNTPSIKEYPLNSRGLKYHDSRYTS